MAIPSHDLRLFAALTPAAAGAILVVWLFALGGAVGSFLNVVVYRVPAAKSLVFPGSHCPACRHPIRWFDNVPILSWFVLRGRCRDCGSRISTRYPIVEAITAALFVLVGVVEGLSGGANLPLSPGAASGGVTVARLDVGQSAAVVGYHLVLLCTLLAAALIEHDGHRVPGRLFAPALLLGWLAPLACPSLHPVPALGAIAADLPRPVAGSIDGTAGLAVGALLGLGLWRLPSGSRGFGLLLGPAAVGLFLGWQAGLVVTLLTAACWAAVSGLRRLVPGLRPVPPTAWLALGALGWIVAWGPIVARWPFLG
jgi:leader peptidase (prepilin peptidase)/N-methyltransferase